MNRLWRAVAFAVVLGALSAPATGAFALDTPPDDKGNLSVVVTDGTSPSPSPSATRSGGGTSPLPGTSSTSGSAGTSSTGGAGVAGVPAGSSGSGGSTPAADEVGVAGMIYLSGLNSSVAISPDPGGGTVRLWFTVRNASQSTIDATADFWMNSQLFGNRLDSAERVAITALLPGESRVVTTDLHHGGQWTVVDAHVTLTPPESVDGTALTPITRDAFVFIFPWLVAVGLGVILAGFFVVRAVRASMILSPALADPV